RLRQLLPVQWTAVVLHDETAPVKAATRRVLGADGLLPAWLDITSGHEQSPGDVSVVPIYGFESGAMLLLAGPRLDGGRLDGIQLEAMQMLARAVAAALAASLMR